MSMKRPESLVEDELVELQLERRLISYVIEQLTTVQYKVQYLRCGAHGQGLLRLVIGKKDTPS